MSWLWTSVKMAEYKVLKVYPSLKTTNIEIIFWGGALETKENLIEKPEKHIVKKKWQNLSKNKKLYGIRLPWSQPSLHSSMFALKVTSTFLVQVLVPKVA